ncbi:MAG: threonylcarbamoyl-AMP synthase [Candidatus Zixiibacteriota bacterium]|nr:MAG: threonylcarbamoyl-AMP synthase [candidate division Zixibacteria bacterium]
MSGKKKKDRLTDPEKIASLFVEGAVILFPTDTVIGLGCRFDSEDSISRIREIKGIKTENPLAVLVSSLDDLIDLKVRKSRVFNKLIEKMWPGGLTVVLSSEDSYACCGEGNTLGLRMPDSDLVRKIIIMAGIPIAATSANFHGVPPPARIEDVDSRIIKKVDYVLDLPVKGVGLPSTVVKIEAGDIRIIREGAISSEEIFEVTRGIA